MTRDTDRRDFNDPTRHHLRERQDRRARAISAPYTKRELDDYERSLGDGVELDEGMARLLNTARKGVEDSARLDALDVERFSGFGAELRGTKVEFWCNAHEGVRAPIDRLFRTRSGRADSSGDNNG